MSLPECSSEGGGVKPARRICALVLQLTCRLWITSPHMSCSFSLQYDARRRPYKPQVSSEVLRLENSEKLEVHLNLFGGDERYIVGDY